MGKEWTTSSGEWEHNNPMWIKIISPRGEVQSINWMENYKILRKAINIDFPGNRQFVRTITRIFLFLGMIFISFRLKMFTGYMIHESGLWSAVHSCWFFLPRRCSTHRYNETLDEVRSCNLLFRADENFSNIKVSIK